MLHLSTVQRRTIMNKFRRLLESISAETCLKWIILVYIPKIAKRWELFSKTPLSPAAGDFALRPPVRFND